MNSIWTLAVKDLRILLRDRSGSFFVFFYPVLIAVFMGVVFSGGGGSGSHKSALSVYVIDQDSTDISQNFVKALAQSEDLQITPTGLDQAQEDVRRGRMAAYILIKSGYGEARKNMFGGEVPAVEVGIDPSRRGEAGLLTGVLMKCGAMDKRKIFADRNLLRKQVRASLLSLKNIPAEESNRRINFLFALDGLLADTAGFAAGGGWGSSEPLTIEEKNISLQIVRPPSSFAITFPQGIMWGIITCVTTFALSLVTERNKGTLMRLLSAPLKSSQILGSKALVCFSTAIFISVVLMLIGIFIFDIRIASYPKLMLGLVIVAGSFVGVMMLLSVLSKSERAAGNIGWAVMLVMTMIGGGMLPLFFMPDWLKALSSISPIKWSILALEGAIWRDFTYQELLQPYLVLAAFGVVSFFIGVRLFRWSEQN